jgi:hypothetical protein
VLAVTPFLNTVENEDADDDQRRDPDQSRLEFIDHADNPLGAFRNQSRKRRRMQMNADIIQQCAAVIGVDRRLSCVPQPSCRNRGLRSKLERLADIHLDDA